MEFVNLFNSYRTLPTYSIGVSGGVNLSQVKVLESYGTYNLNDDRGKYKYNGLGYQVGAKINFYLKERIELNAEITLMGNKFQYKNTMFGYADLTLNETQTNLQVPVSITYDFGRSKIKPFLRLGGYAGYLLGDNGSFTRKYNDNSFADVTGPAISLLKQRNVFNYGLIAGGKIRCKAGAYFSRCPL